jgi:hypothetical protein
MSGQAPNSLIFKCYELSGSTKYAMQNIDKHFHHG